MGRTEKEDRGTVAKRSRKVYTANKAYKDKLRSAARKKESQPGCTKDEVDTKALVLVLEKGMSEEQEGDRQKQENEDGGEGDDGIGKDLEKEEESQAEMSPEY